MPRIDVDSVASKLLPLQCGILNSWRTAFISSICSWVICNASFRASRARWHKLAIFNGGSFFPNSELPADFQRFVYQDVNSRKHIKQLMVEAYPSFISEVKLREATEILNSTDLKIGIGFESQNDIIRNVILKKRIKRELFEEKGG